MRFSCIIVVIVTVFGCVRGYSQDDMKDFLSVGFSNIDKITIDGAVTLVNGTVPDWLNGNFIRHSCFNYGSTDHKDISEPNYVNHLFDCIESGSKFMLRDGQVTFTNRYYDTTTNDIFNIYGRNMNKSSVFYTGAFLKANGSQVDKWASYFKNSTKVGEVPSVSWWKVGDQAVAMSEGPIGVVINTDDVTQMGEIVYKDSNMGYGPDVMFANNPAHEQTEPDGTLWSTVVALKQVSGTEMKIWQVVYKVGADRVRHVVGEYPYDNADLTQCRPGLPYPHFGARVGYLHSFVMTEHYIVLPEANYLHDPCMYVRYDAHTSFFPQAFTDEPNMHSRLLVMRKSDGKFIANIKAPGFFVTHQLGAYEDGELIHMDMLMYNDSSIYTRYTYVDSLMSSDNYVTDVKRITINTTEWTASLRNLRHGPPKTFEMSNINYAVYGQKYTYAYMIRNFDKAGESAITKLNVDTGEELEYVLPEGMFAQEPIFVPRPSPPGSSGTAQGEDDGVLLSQGVDGRRKKGFLLIIDARTMQLVAHLTAPDLTLFGIHNKFFRFDELNVPSLVG